ncbi:Protein of unknown function [Blastococcus sp. DSM 46786]|uniref:DUF3710 domain-containing protein n=1 Tax=Blastococcus sp. DSM 46786 TaxID=1798227 RepID=UPI0008CC976E|nr:DUF3710 domain-containing protein [Blastococcus sp. DSM 46786]SEL11989.1 Protein of unknown function [Blastococcus sp. DSM 46786]
MPFGRRRSRIDRSLRERGVPPEPQQRIRDIDETTGPWDEADAPEDGLARIDLGAIRLPALPGMDLRVELNQQQKVIGATLRHGNSLLQVAAFAAPRAGGIWDDVRAELARSASGQGASLREVEGPFGLELAGTVMAAVAPQPGQPTPPATRRPARFLGVDGPRWFLRGLLSGSAAAGGEAEAAALEAAFRGIVVVRGSEPMPVREPLPLALPPQAAAQLAAQQPPPGAPPSPPGAAPQPPPGAARQPPAGGPAGDPA